jgi:hypothetical protein
MRGPRHKAARLALTLILGLQAAAAMAAGGPPMVTDDPETPGDGRWEINAAAIYSRTRAEHTLTLPDLDINYGLGERIQLKVDVPWARVTPLGESSRSGPGNVELGVKWRFYDDEASGVSLSTYPQYGRALNSSSIARGTASPGHEFFLPIEGATEVGGVGLVGEVGKNFVQGEKGQWVAGVVATHACGAATECMAEVRHTQGDGQHQTLLNFGLHHKLDDTLSLLMAVGTERGTQSDDRHQALVYVGLQFTH